MTKDTGLVGRWRETAKLLREGQHEDGQYLAFAVKLEMCADELAAFTEEHLRPETEPSGLAWPTLTRLNAINEERARIRALLVGEGR